MTHQAPGRSGRRRSSPLVLFAAAALALGHLAAPALAQSGECAPGAGITVVVDFAGLGGEVAVGCAPAPGTGFEALTQAGFKVTPTQSNQAFVCRIDGLPDAAAEDCTDTPPADAFWSYWVADLGGSWRTSGTGAAGPVAADLEGWSFSGEPPRFTPPPAATTTTSTSTATTTTTTTPTTTTTTTTTPATTSITATTTTTTTATTTSTTTTTTTVPSTTSPATTAVTTAPTTTVPAIAPRAAAENDESSPVGVVVGVIAIAGLGAAGLAIARRRSGGADA